MIKKFKYVILILLLVIPVSASQLNLKIIKTIGDERNDYFFYQIGSVVCSNEKDIYITDLKGQNISKFGWDGSFVKSEGTSGQGPGDIISPILIDINSNIVQIYDNRSFTITSLSNNLNIIEHKKLKKMLFIRVNFLKNNMFLGIKSFNFRTKKKNLIFVFDKSERIHYSFFNNNKISNKYSDMEIKDKNMYSSFFNIRVGLSNDREKIIVTQDYVMNPASFYIYNINGELKRKFSYKYKNNYRFINIRSKKRNLKPFILTVDAMFVLEKFIFIHIVPVKNRNVSNDISEVNHFLIFDRSGKFVLRKNINKKFGEKFYQITNDKYLIGSRMDEDIEKIVISKIEIKDY